MIDKNIIERLLQDLESDRVERTVSTTNTDKFGQALCAFANDLPASGKPGYLIIGADDNGTVQPINITDELLKNIAAIRTDGNMQPQPSMVVEKVPLDGGDVVVVEIQPAVFPPVKYKGRIWVRVGPRKSVANEADEKILYEKRAAGIRTFDAMPCIGATLDDIDVTVFKRAYLPQAVPDDVIDADKRDIRLQMQSLGFWDARFDCPTYAGLVMFGKNVERFLPGAYVQYVRFRGKTRAGEIMNEHKFAGNLCKVLFQLDTFVDASITNRRPVPVSALREETIKDYPHWATRELLMNAVCHRDYESNGPVQFYQYDDRIEILNPGGLYGKVTKENFPNVNDYRNSVIAEAMKVLGFVNRFSRGVLRVEEELQENGNGKPQFSLDLGTAFVVTEPISQTALAWDREHPDWKNERENDTVNGTVNGTVNKTDSPVNKRNSQSRRNGEGENETVNGTDNGTNYGTNHGDNNDTIVLSLNHRNIYNAIKYNNKVKYTELMDNLGLGRMTIYRLLSDLKETGYIKRLGNTRRGTWIILKQI